MRKVIIYLLLGLFLVFSMFAVEHIRKMPSWYVESLLFVRCKDFCKIRKFLLNNGL